MMYILRKSGLLATPEAKASGSAAAQESPRSQGDHGVHSKAAVLRDAALLTQRIEDTEADLAVMRAELQRLLQVAEDWPENPPDYCTASSNASVNNDAAIAAALEQDAADLPSVKSVPFAMECSICLTEVNDQGQVAIVDGCGHSFCGGCLAQFLNSNPAIVMDEVRAVPVCPACKATMPAGQATAITRELIGEMHAKTFLAFQEVLRLDQLMIRTALGPAAGMCSCITCGTHFQVETFDQAGELVADETGARVNPNQVKCPVCEVYQCARCGVGWDTHGFRSCTDYQAMTHLRSIDSQTRQLLDKEVVRCPGPCGQGLSKVEHTCNVLRCMNDRIYVCALCGAKLDSSEFRPHDPGHARANKHYQEVGTPCFNALFTPRAQWLRQRR